jgi:hypothetical protein
MLYEGAKVDKSDTSCSVFYLLVKSGVYTERSVTAVHFEIPANCALLDRRVPRLAFSGKSEPTMSLCFKLPQTC